jgi:hypothetical protein
MSQQQNLSGAQLAALDLMIAHMQENGQTQLGGFWDAITNTAENAATHAWAGPITGISGLDDDAFVPAIATAADMVGPATSTTEDVSALVGKLNESGLQPQLTLENLIRIRNQFTK